MVTTKKPTQAKTGRKDIDEFMRKLEHPLKPEMEAVLSLIRRTDPVIAEGIKWNAPSFRVGEYFATINLRAKAAVQIILHLGAKARNDITARLTIEDANALLHWLARDRASVEFRDMNESRISGRAFQEVVRQWIAHLKQA